MAANYLGDAAGNDHGEGEEAGLGEVFAAQGVGAGGETDARLRQDEGAFAEAGVFQAEHFDTGAVADDLDLDRFGSESLTEVLDIVQDDAVGRLARDVHLDYDSMGVGGEEQRQAGLERSHNCMIIRLCSP